MVDQSNEVLHDVMAVGVSFRDGGFGITGSGTTTPALEKLLWRAFRCGERFANRMGSAEERLKMATLEVRDAIDDIDTRSRVQETDMRVLRERVEELEEPTKLVSGTRCSRCYQVIH